MNRTIGIVSTNYTFSSLGGLVERRSPASVPFGGAYRLMDFALSNMVNSQIKTVGLVTPYYYRSMMDHVGAGKSWDLDRKEGGLHILPGSVFGFKEEGKRFLFRDLTHNMSYLERGDGDYILFAAADLVYNIDYRPMIEQHELSGNQVTLLYKKMSADAPAHGQYLTLDASGRVTHMTEDPEDENLFLSCFIINKPFLMQLVRDFRTVDFMDLTAIFSQVLKDAAIGAFEFKGYVGFSDSLQEYMNTSMALLRSEVRRELFPHNRSVRTKPHDTPPALYAKGSEVRNSLVAGGSIIHGTVENSIISRNCRIEEGAVVRNCVLMDRCVVHAGAVLENVICDKKVTVSADISIKGTNDQPCVIKRSETI